ncbi:MAG TPA: CHASE3 domain-containing protein [Myxococcales bacterium]|jgi:signal transduction histidine kinase|nr:CHASE3 domain-containing protein [Myxococcales bacterium]
MRIVAAFVAAVLAIGAVTAASLRSLSARRDGSLWVMHTQEVQLSIARVLALAEEAETRQRGYLITGRVEDARTFREAQAALSPQVDTLARLAQDNPRHQQRLVSLRALLERRSEALSRAVDLRERGDPAALDPAQTAAAVERMQSMRAILREMGEEENALLADRLRRLTRADRWSMGVTLGGAILLLVLAATAAVVVRGDLRRREEQARDRARVLEYQERLIAIAGHDLRNPLTAVLVSAQMLLQKREELKPGQANAVDRILRSASRIDALAALLIDFTYARLGKGIPMRPGPVDARAVVERSVDELRAAHPMREIRLDMQAPAFPGSWDGDRISQLVSNLVANALQYGAPQAPVTVTLTREAADALEIRVHNHGAPLAPELRQRLFEPYQRGKGAESTHPRGLGLGLFIVREIARAHGGSIDVDSDADGTQFVVHLPRRAPGTAGAAAAQGTTAGVPAA